ncbi:MAG TPA: hypothetical protein VMU51_23500 [Mycobacteriales bacterium]|nr:hypothetical protein [Mycobacteriales bacterium]
MTRTTRLRALRWGAPALVVAAIAVTASGVLSADANPPLPARTAAQLLVDLESARVDGLSGTIVHDASLGLPELPTSGPGASTSLTSLLSGPHTLRVWASGADKHRVALLGNLGESDVIHNGQNVWIWDSQAKTAAHYIVPAGALARHVDPEPTGMTPQEVADAALKAIDPTTTVTTDGTASVAGRSAYELVLSPKDTRSLVGQVRLALDSETHIPLRVQVFARGGTKPSYEVAFSRISFAVPDDEEFQFSPPPGTKVTDRDKPSSPGMSDEPGSKGSEPRVVGKGWTAVVVIPGVSLANPNGPATGPGGGSLGELTPILNRLPRVSGSWGSGRLLAGTLFSALATDDGRLLVGTVSPDVLYQAARQR